MSHKWTEVEVRRIVEEENHTAALEVLKYLCERGPSVVAWGDSRDPEREEDERIERELRAADDIDEECDGCGAPAGELCRPVCG